MTFQIESPHLEIDRHLEQLVQQKFDHLSKMYSRLHRCEVVLRKEKDDRQRSCSIEASLHVPGHVFFAKEHDTTFEVALEQLISDLEHQLLKHKEMVEERR